MKIQNDDFASFCIGATGVICFVAVLFVNVFCSENLKAQPEGQSEYDATIFKVADSIPYFTRVINYILDKWEGTPAEPELPLTAPVQTAPIVNPLRLKKLVRFHSSVASATASPHYEEDFFFADIPAADV